MWYNCLVKLTLQITCQWIGIERYKLSALYAHFYIEKWMNFLFFFLTNLFWWYLPCFSLFWTNFFLNDRCIMYIWTSEVGMFLGGMVVSPAAATAVEKRLSIFRVIKVNLSFGELKIFQMVQNFNNIQSMSYIFIVWKKIEKN